MLKKIVVLVIVSVAQGLVVPPSQHHRSRALGSTAADDAGIPIHPSWIKGVIAAMDTKVRVDRAPVVAPPVVEMTEDVERDAKKIDGRTISRQAAASDIAATIELTEKAGPDAKPRDITPNYFWKAAGFGPDAATKVDAVEETTIQETVVDESQDFHEATDYQELAKEVQEKNRALGDPSPDDYQDRAKEIQEKNRAINYLDSLDDDEIRPIR